MTTDGAIEHRAARRARIGVAMLFLTNGALFANLLPRYPEVKADLGLGNAQYGLAVAAFPAGALIAGLAAGVLIRRYRSSRVAVAGTLLTSVGVLLAGVAPNGVLFAAALFVGGAMDAVTDVAQNSHGLRVQRRYGRSIIKSFHAIWSVGAVLGGLMGAAAAGLAVPLPVHLGASAVTFVAVSLVAHRLLLPGREPVDVEPTPDPSGGRKSRAAGIGRYAVLTALVLIAASGAKAVGLGFQRGPRGGRRQLLGVGVPVGLARRRYRGRRPRLRRAGRGQFVGRLVGDRMVDRFGQRLVARFGGAVTMVGMGAALVFPSIPGTIAGFAAAGFGVATGVPAAMLAADELPGLLPGTGLTLVSWLMRIGFLLSPPIVGLVADATSLRVGLLVIPLAGLIVVSLAGVLAARTRRDRSAVADSARLD